MSLRLILLILLILLIPSLLLNVFLWKQAVSRSIVVSVPDGDSLDLADGRRIRLLGIDAPERGRCMADEARTFLTGQVLGRHIRLKEPVTDDFGRVLAHVFVGQTLVSQLMLKEGLARYTFSAGSKSQYGIALKSAVDQAKAAKRGIWSDICRNTDPKGDCVIKGNIRSGKKTYFLPDCPNYSDVIVEESFGDAWFCSENEAKAAGFAKPQYCP